MNLDAISEAIPENPFVQNLRFVPETESTSEDLKRLANDSQNTNILLLADHQHAGKGRTGPWVDSPGTMILMSLLVRPELTMNKAQCLVDIAAEAVLQALHCELNPQEAEQLWVKAPNDVYWGSKKLAGILLDSQSQAEQMLWAVLGIGINVNNSEQFFQGDLLEQGTSLALIDHREHRREQIVGNFLIYFKEKYDELLANEM